MIQLLLLSIMICHAYGLHVNCSVTISVRDSSIKELNSSLVDSVLKREGFYDKTCLYAELEAGFCGYSVVSLSSVSNHFQHQMTSGSSYDDIIFSAWTTVNTSTTVHALSKSEWPNAYDYDANFCNIFNLFRNGNASSLNYDCQLNMEYVNITLILPMVGIRHIHIAININSTSYNTCALYSFYDLKCMSFASHL
eukprot:702865_1